MSGKYRMVLKMLIGSLIQHEVENREQSQLGSVWTSILEALALN